MDVVKKSIKQSERAKIILKEAEKKGIVVAYGKFESFVNLNNIKRLEAIAILTVLKSRCEETIKDLINAGSESIDCE